MRSRTAVLLVLPPPYGHDDCFKKGVNDLCTNAVYNRPCHINQNLHLCVGFPFLQHNLIFSEKPNLTYLYKSYVSSSVAGPTVTCAAAPVPNQTCNYPAYGYGQYLISQMMGIPAIACHERCLADPKCLSFQVEDPGGSDYCNTFSNRTMGNVLYDLGGGYTFFDRNCPDYLPVNSTYSIYYKLNFL